jgi:hypothetical protein
MYGEYSNKVLGLDVREGLLHYAFIFIGVQ